MTIGPQLTIQTPAGLVEIGDTIKIDVSNDPVARNYNWPKVISGMVYGAHDDHLLVRADVAIPQHLVTPMPPAGFGWRLSEDNADQVVEVVKPCQT